MSGPKCDEFDLFEELERQERERIREELRARKRREREERRRQEEEQRREEEERRRQEELRRLEEEERRRREEEERRRREEEERQRREAAEKAERESESDDFNEAEEAELAALEEKLYQRRKEEIVAKAMDEVMQEMGYELVASMTPPVSDEDHFIQAQVFSFGDGSGVQVMEAEGQISLEVVGIGTNDRTPSEQEAEFLECKMGEFCQAYQVLVEKLAKRGIVRSAVKYHQEPNKKYARILNVDVFEKKKEVETLQHHIKSKEKKQSGKSDEVLLLQDVQQSSSNS